MRPAYCTGCRRRVLWALTAHRKWLALNPEPDPGGNQAAYRDANGGWLTRQMKDGEEPYGYERRFMPHVATCTAPQAAPARPGQAAPGPVRRRLPDNVIPISRARRRGATPIPQERRHP